MRRGPDEAGVGPRVRSRRPRLSETSPTVACPTLLPPRHVDSSRIGLSILGLHNSRAWPVLDAEPRTRLFMLAFVLDTPPLTRSRPVYSPRPA